MSKTEWYPASVKPARNGLYEIRISKDALTWAVWNGDHWSKASEDIDWVLEIGVFGMSFWQDREWRGLREPA